MNAATDPRIYRVAILAMGGEGGGVLADWLVEMAERAGYHAQTTSVPGVAQRTGATIYYVEFVAADASGREPVLSLMPVPGEVDLVVASELMEAGRALQRGLVSKERSVLIASTHRVYSMTEMTAMSDGRVSSEALLAACRQRARQFIGADFASLAGSQGSVVSASLFGAMAACGELPFSRQQFEQAIEHSGVGVRSSLAAFALGYQRATERLDLSGAPGVLGESSLQAGAAPGTPADLGTRLKALRPRIERFPVDSQGTLVAAVLKLAEYQDAAHSAEYLDQADACWAKLSGGQQAADALRVALFESLMRGLANWMSYEDIVRVAELKTRSARFARVAEEVRVDEKQILEIREYLHPRIEEVADVLPPGPGRFLLASPLARGILRPLLGEGRIVQTSSIRGYLLMFGLAAMRPWRRASMRWSLERQKMNAWKDLVLQLSTGQPALSRALADAQVLIKGYSDTHQRGRKNFETLLNLAPSLTADPRGAEVMRKLTQAAQADEQGLALQASLDALRQGRL